MTFHVFHSLKKLSLQTKTIWPVAYPEFFFGGRGGFARKFFGGRSTPGAPPNFQMSETRILIRLLRIYFPRISEFGPATEFRGWV
jgi:hypothetical protein